MKIMIISHSTTGNTRLVARHVVLRLRKLGHDCQIYHLRKFRDPPDLTGVDLVGIAFPVMYFRPTLAMEQLVDRLTVPTGTPAFVLATAAGDPGAALHLMMDRLGERGFTPLDAHWVIAPSNYPVQLAPIELLRGLPLVGSAYRTSAAVTRTAGKHLGGRRWRQWRPLTGSLYPDLCIPVKADRAWLDRFTDGVLTRAVDLEAGRTPAPPDLKRHTHRVLVWAGKAFPPDAAISKINLRADGTRCTQCNLCVEICPVGCVVRDGAGVPQFGPGCTGCYACYNACDFGAISAMGTPNGLGRYAGPPRAMRKLFSPKG